MTLCSGHSFLRGGAGPSSHLWAVLGKEEGQVRFRVPVLGAAPPAPAEVSPPLAIATRFLTVLMSYSRKTEI